MTLKFLIFNKYNFEIIAITFYKYRSITMKN